MCALFFGSRLIYYAGTGDGGKTALINERTEEIFEKHGIKINLISYKRYLLQIIFIYAIIHK